MKTLTLRYQAPATLLEEADREMAAVPQDRLFNDSAHQKIKEKWCAAMLGLGYEKFIAPCRVAVNDTMHRVDADLFIETAGREYPFQLVEVMEPDRPRGAEYKAIAKGILPTTPYRPERGHIEGPGWIADKIKQKVEKNYAGAKELNVLVYADFTARDLQHADVVKAARPYLDAFASVWAVSSLWLGSLHEEANDRFDQNRQRH